MTLNPNLGRLRNALPGITGVAPGSVATVQMPTGQRYHRLQLNCQAVNYTAPTLTLVGAGTYNATLTPVVVNGQITSVTITAAGSSMTNGTYTTAGGGAPISDATGVGAQVSVVVSSGAVASVTVISGGLAGPIAPAALITSLRIKCNGVVIRDITPAQILSICVANGYLPQYGSLPIFFTEPWRNMLRDNALTSWDMAGQSSFSLEFGISANVVNPGIVGVYEWDSQRNTRPIKSAAQAALITRQLGINPATGAAYKVGDVAPFLQIIAQHSNTAALAVGVTPITTIPFNNPITRLWLVGSNPGNLYSLEALVDGTIRYQCSSQQMAEDASEYNFQAGSVFVAPAIGGGWGAGTPYPGNTVTASGVKGVPTTIPNGQLTQSSWLEGTNQYPFDMALIFDPDQRPWEACRTLGSFVLRVGSNVAQNLTIISETLTGAYTG